MNKAILISIRPKWCELIASGKKTIEVRKTCPKLEPPFKCYIYCTLSGSKEFFEETCRGDVASWNRSKMSYKKGAVIGEFVCAEIDRYARYGWLKEPARYMKSSPGGYPATEIHFANLKISPSELEEYGKGAPLFGWHISDLVIYDEPKQLKEFEVFRTKHITEKAFFQEGVCDEIRHVRVLEPLSRPPQSWCYVREFCDNMVEESRQEAGAWHD